MHLISSLRSVPVHTNVEFKSWGKIPRDNPFNVTITEKIDGTNACVIIQGGAIVGVQSRKRMITPEGDNYGFAKWVGEHEEHLLTLGDGYHYGEWAGEGIQKNPLKLTGKHFFLFNTFRGCPECCSTVPVLFQGAMEVGTVPLLLSQLASDTEVEHEGVVVFYHTFRAYTKHTIKSRDGKWCK